MSLRRQPSSADFEKLYTKMLSNTADMDGPTVKRSLRINIERQAAVWVERDLRPFSEDTATDTYNTAIELGTFCMFARRHSFAPYIMNPQGQKVAEVPPQTEPEFQDDSGEVRFGLTSRAWSCITWANSESIAPEQLTAGGIRILGVLATLPEGCGPGVLAPYVYRMIPRIDIAGAPPYLES